MTAICFVCNLPILSHQVGLVWKGGNGFDELVREQEQEEILRARLGRRDSAAQITTISPPTEVRETSPPTVRRRRSSLAQLTDLLREWGSGGGLRKHDKSLSRRETLADLARSLPWGRRDSTITSTPATRTKRRESSADVIKGKFSRRTSVESSGHHSHHGHKSVPRRGSIAQIPRRHVTSPGTVQPTCSIGTTSMGTSTAIEPLEPIASSPYTPPQIPSSAEAKSPIEVVSSGASGSGSGSGGSNVPPAIPIPQEPAPPRKVERRQSLSKTKSPERTSPKPGRLRRQSTILDEFGTKRRGSKMSMIHELEQLEAEIDCHTQGRELKKGGRGGGLGRMSIGMMRRGESARLPEVPFLSPEDGIGGNNNTEDQIKPPRRDSLSPDSCTEDGDQRLTRRHSKRRARRQSTVLALNIGQVNEERRGSRKSPDSSDGCSSSSREPSPVHPRPNLRRQSTTEEILIARGFRRQSTSEEMMRCRNFRSTQFFKRIERVEV